MILSPAQAKAVYSAMCALNNSGFASNRVTAHSEENAHWDVTVEWNNNSIAVYLGFIGSVESYANQAAFATAYGLNSDEWQSDVAAAAGGLTQTAIER